MENNLPIILLAEDDAIIADLFQLMLRNSSRDIIMVGDGNLAVEQYRDKDFDFIFMDMQMPRMDGLEATRRIRELQRSTGRTPELKIIGLTASNDVRDRHACIEAGMDRVMIKPFSKKELEDALKINE